MNINGLYSSQLKKINKYKWNPLCKNNSILITSVLSIATASKPKMEIESYTSNDKEIKHPDKMLNKPFNYTKIKNETEKFIFRKVNVVDLSNDKATSIDSISYKHSIDYIPSTVRNPQCSLIKKKIFESEVSRNQNQHQPQDNVLKSTVMNRSSTPLTYRHHIKRGNDYNDICDNDKDLMRRSHQRDVSADFVYEQTKENYLTNINIDHLIMLEDKLLEILSSVTKNESTSTECKEWLSYYFNSSLSGECYEEFFNNDKSSQVIIHTANNLELFSVFICYFISTESYNCNKVNQFFKNVFHYLHINYLLICKVIIEKSKIKLYSKQKRLWVEKVNNHTSQQMRNDKDRDGMNIVLKIKNNCKIIVQDIKSILSNYTHVGIYDNLIQTFNNLTRLTNNDLNEFFKKHILQYQQNSNDNDKDNDKYIDKKDNCDPNNKQNHQIINVNNNNENDMTPPFIITKPNKQYTLVLDLDETLVSSKMVNLSAGKGKVKFRPSLRNFLSQLRDYYEIISFTAGNKDVSYL